MLAAWLNRVPTISQRVDRRLVIRTHECEVAGRRLGVGDRHQMDLLSACSPGLEPHSASRDSVGYRDRLEAEDSVEVDASIEERMGYLVGDVVDHQSGFLGSPGCRTHSDGPRSVQIAGIKAFRLPECG